MPQGQRAIDGELSHRSDRGSQYASYDYQNALEVNSQAASAA